MPPVLYDRVMEMSSTAGTGPYVLTGPPFGFRAFSAVGDGQTCYYCAEDVDATGKPSGQWEVGLGTYTASGTTLTRTTILVSSNANAPVNWGAGTRRVFLTVPAAKVALAEGWINVPFNAANFTAVGGGTWTVNAAAVAVNRYTVINKTMHWQVYFSWFAGTNVVAGTVTGLNVVVPGGLSLQDSGMNPVVYSYSGGAGDFLVTGGGTLVTFQRRDFGNIVAGTVGLVTTMTWALV